VLSPILSPKQVDHEIAGKQTKDHAKGQQQLEGPYEMSRDEQARMLLAKSGQ